MDENSVHEPLLQCNEETVTKGDRDSRAVGSVTLNHDVDAAPILSSNSDKWKFKYHCVLSGEEFSESHDHSQGMQLFSPSLSNI